MAAEARKFWLQKEKEKAGSSPFVGVLCEGKGEGERRREGDVAAGASLAACVDVGEDGGDVEDGPWVPCLVEVVAFEAANECSMADFWSQMMDADELVASIGKVGESSRLSELEEEKFEIQSHFEGAAIPLQSEVDMLVASIGKEKGGESSHLDELEEEKFEIQSRFEEHTDGLIVEGKGGESSRLAKLEEQKFEIVSRFESAVAVAEEYTKDELEIQSRSDVDPFANYEEYITSSHWSLLAGDVAYACLGDRAKCCECDVVIGEATDIALEACHGLEDSLIYSDEELVWSTMRVALADDKYEWIRKIDECLGVAPKKSDVGVQTNVKVRGKKHKSSS